MLHLSVYHALRVLPGDTPHGGAPPEPPASYGGPLSYIFPRLRHLSATLTPGVAGRPAAERWGFLAGAGGRCGGGAGGGHDGHGGGVGLGASLRSLHLRAISAGDLELQVGETKCQYRYRVCYCVGRRSKE